MRVIQRFVLVIFVIIAITGVTFGQRTTATFAGIVTDPSGAVLPGAEVRLINEGTSAVMEQLTGETGEFVMDFVPAGVYTLRIVMPGFKTYESRSIPLNSAQNARRTYVLEVGSVAENVTVTGEAPLVNTVSTEQRISIDTIEVKALPMANRNILNVISVGPGLLRQKDTGGGRAGNRFRLNGLGGSAMSVTANGSDANGQAGSPNISNYGAPGKIDVMSSEAVAEMQVVKGVMPAEYGSAMAGNLSVITKSGTNGWHGSLFHRYEGSVLSARNPVLSHEPNSVWNQFGGSMGGPIKRDRAFFFAAYEGYRQRSSISIDPTVPTPRFREILMTYLPFPETKIVLNYYPLPNQPYGPNDLLARWVGPGESVNNDDHFDWKVDYLIGGGNFALSFSGGHPYQLRAQSQPLDPRSFTTSSQRASATYVKAWGGGHWTSSTRAGYNRNYFVRLDKLWSEKDPVRPETIPGQRRVRPFSFPGMTGLNSEIMIRGTSPSWQFEQQFSYFRGTHSFKFGGVLSLPSGGRPGTDARAVPFQTLDDIMRNEPASVAFTPPQNPWKWIYKNFGFFFQDDWRVNRKLVLNLGLRYDRYDHYVAKPWHEDLPACLCNLDGLLDSVNFIWGPLRPLDNPFNSDPLSLGPRFGFVYTADDKGNFVVRGGFGVNFQSYDVQIYETPTGHSPHLPRRSYNRLEARARGIKYPVYHEDLTPLVRADAGDKPHVGNRYDPNSKPPYAMNYTLGIQRALTSTLVLETAYVGTRGVKFNLSRTYNREDRITGIRPNPDDISGSYTDNSQQTNYNSWQSSLKQRLSHGLLFGVSHTWGKAMSYSGGDNSDGNLGDTFGGIEDFNNVKIERSTSAGDVTHSFVANWVYQVPTPFANSGVARHILGGWEISGIWRSRTGENLGVTQTGGRPDLIDFKGAVNKKCCSHGNLQYLNPAAFQRVPVSPLSNLTIRRGIMGNRPLRGPHLHNLDFSLAKNFSIGEKRTLELKADLLNALNNTQYTGGESDRPGISTDMNSVVFGKATGTEPARQIQVQLRITF